MKFAVDTKPDLVTCRIGTESSQAEARNSTTNGDCANEQDRFIRFQPTALSFVFEMSLSVDISPKSITYPLYVKPENTRFGIVDATIQLLKYNVQGKKSLNFSIKYRIDQCL